MTGFHQATLPASAYTFSGNPGRRASWTARRSTGRRVSSTSAACGPGKRLSVRAPSQSAAPRRRGRVFLSVSQDADVRPMGALSSPAKVPSTRLLRPRSATWECCSKTWESSRGCVRLDAPAYPRCSSPSGTPRSPSFSPRCPQARAAFARALEIWRKIPGADAEARASSFRAPSGRAPRPREVLTLAGRGAGGEGPKQPRNGAPVPGEARRGPALLRAEPSAKGKDAGATRADAAADDLLRGVIWRQARSQRP